MSLIKLIGPIVELAILILKKYLPGYKDKPAVDRYKTKKELEKWKKDSAENKDERFARSLQRHLSSSDVPPKE